MKLSELVAYKNALDDLSSQTVQREVELELGKIIQLVDSQKIQLGNFKQELDEQYNNIHQTINQFEEKVNNLKQEIKLQIELEEKFWFSESYRLYDQEMRNDSADHVLNRRPILSEDIENTLRARIQNHVDWQHSAMIIQPGLEKFVEDMVGFDPLYLIAQEHNLLVPAFSKFPEEYQRRLRLYTVKENINSTILDKIPNNQFGICLVYNFFEFKPFEVIRTYLTEIYQKLKPGGTLIMTFNDCDREKAVKLAEQRYACYTPGSLVRYFASTIGYDQIFSWNNNGPTTWLELRKPGTLTSLRGGQTLAKIKLNFDPEEHTKLVKEEAWSLGIRGDLHGLDDLKRMIVEEREKRNKNK
jgi:SAM-dependent methyltransferase